MKKMEKIIFFSLIAFQAIFFVLWVGLRFTFSDSLPPQWQIRLAWEVFFVFTIAFLMLVWFSRFGFSK